MKALRDTGLQKEAATMDRAYENALDQAPPHEQVPLTKTPETAPQPNYRLADIRELGSYAITWVNPVKIIGTVGSVPWWGWLGLLSAYAGSAGLRARASRSSKPLTLLLRLKERP